MSVLAQEPQQGWPGISVLILTKNRLPLLRLVLEALSAQLLPGDEVLVCDTGSTDGTAAWLKGAGAAIGPVAIRAVDGGWQGFDFATARNQLVGSACRPVVAFIDDDCVPRPGWAAAIRRRFGMDPALKALGGIVDPAKHLIFPAWWDARINWTVGLSGPELEAGIAGAAPSTSNLAILREHAMRHPFGELETVDARPGRPPLDSVYRGMREDANWWLEARLRGDRLAIEPSCRVEHHIPQARLDWRYCLKRASWDGAADRERRRSIHLHGLAVSDASRLMLKRMMLRADRADRVWLARQVAAMEGSAGRWTDVFQRELLHALLHRVRQGLQRRARSLLRSAGRWVGGGFHPERRPAGGGERVLSVLAPGFLGDTVLLQPALRAAVARARERGVQVRVWARWPQLLGDAAQGAEVHGGAAADLSTDAIRRLGDCTVAAVPYYGFGDPSLWRRVASRAVTFEWDVGFSKLADPWRAGCLLSKNSALHEVENLARLLAASLGVDVRELQLEPYRLASAAAAGRPDRVRGDHPILVHLHTGHEFKDWPMDRWFDLGRAISQWWPGPIEFIPAPGRAHEALAVWDQTGGSRGEDRLRLSQPTETMHALIDRIASAAMVISGCTGPKHIAHACGVPTATLYGRTEPARWGAFFPGDRHCAIVSPGHDLTDFELAHAAKDHVMRMITSEHAEAKIRKFAEETGLLRQSPS